MSTKFFQSIRRNQRQWMVVITALAMVSFLFIDDFARGRGPLSSFGGALVVGVLFAAAMSIVGYSRQKTAEFGIGGFLVGALLGFVGFGALSQNKPVARTSVGNLSRHDFDEMAKNRQRANQFLASVARRVQGGPTGFGGIDDQSLISYRMLLDDAKKMGIRISDKGVSEFLQQATNNRLTKKDFIESLSEARVGEGELFDILKDELAVRLAIQLIEPPAQVVTVRPEWAQFTSVREPLRYMQQTPQQLWDSFQMMNLKQSLEAVAIPVSDFVSEVGQPSELELSQFFAKYKNNRWIDEARPGFVQMPRVRLAYFTADFEKFERGVDPTDEQVREYYERNKDRYRAPAAKESTAPNLPEDQVPGNEVKPKVEGDSSTPEAPANPDGAAKESDAPKVEGEKKPEEPAKEKEEPAKQNPVKEESAEPKSQCGEEPAAEKPAADKAPEGEGQKSDQAEKQVTPGEGQPEAKPTEDPQSGSQKKSEAEPQPNKAESEIAVPELSNSPESLPESKFRELNDELKSEIREILLRERAFANIATALDKAYEAMIPLGLEYDTATDEDQKKERVKQISDKLKEYAVLHNLEYVETPEWEYENLSVEPIGMAVEGQGRSTVANEVMMRGERGESHMPLYSPRRADLRNKRGAFAYWKIDDTPLRVPELKEELVHSKVVRAWKFDQARLLAEKRAKALVEKAKAEGGNLSAAVMGESVLGSKTDAALSLKETPEFSWLSMAQSVPGAQQDPMTTDIPLIPNAGNDFMKIVFEELNEGEVGVAPNADKSVFYVVKVKDRETSKDDAGVAQQERHNKFLAERFSGMYPIIKSPYESIAQFPQRAIDQAWRNDFEKRHNVEWDEEVTQQQSRRRR